MTLRTERAQATAVTVRRRNRALAVAGAGAAALVVWVIGEPLLGNHLVVEQPGQKPVDLGPGHFAFSAVAASLLGWALLAGLERATARAGRIWAAVALAVLALSFFPVLGVDASGTVKAVLALAHLAVGAVLIPVFWSTATAGRRRGSTTADG